MVKLKGSSSYEKNEESIPKTIYSPKVHVCSGCGHEYIQN